MQTIIPGYIIASVLGTKAGFKAMRIPDPFEHRASLRAVRLSKYKHVIMGWTLDKKRKRIVYLRNGYGLCSVGYDGKNYKVRTVGIKRKTLFY